MASNDWAVYRIDFTGNDFLVEKRLTEALAHQLAAELEAHGHHQHYWACRIPDSPVDFAQMLRDSLKSGSPLHASLQVLRNQGASVNECINALREACGLKLSECKRALLLSQGFEDQLDIDPN